MSHRLPALLFLASSPALLGACASESVERRRDTDELAARHTAELRHFDAQRAAFAASNPVPQKLEFPGKGTILVHECRLRGRLGVETFWMRYSYVNTTGHPIEAAHVTLHVLDAAGGDHVDEASAHLPLGFPFTPNSSYTTFAEVPVHDWSDIERITWKFEVRTTE